MYQQNIAWYIFFSCFLKVKELKGNQFTPEAYSLLIGAMPLLKTLTCDLFDPVGDILHISLGLRHTGLSLTHISLNCRNVSQNFVSHMILESLRDVIRDRIPASREDRAEGPGITSWWCGEFNKDLQSDCHNDRNHVSIARFQETLTHKGICKPSKLQLNIMWTSGYLVPF